MYVIWVFLRSVDTTALQHTKFRHHTTGRSKDFANWTRCKKNEIWDDFWKVNFLFLKSDFKIATNFHWRTLLSTAPKKFSVYPMHMMWVFETFYKHKAFDWWQNHGPMTHRSDSVIRNAKFSWRMKKKWVWAWFQISHLYITAYTLQLY